MTDLTFESTIPVDVYLDHLAEHVIGYPLAQSDGRLFLHWGIDLDARQWGIKGLSPVLRDNPFVVVVDAIDDEAEPQVQRRVEIDTSQLKLVLDVRDRDGADYLSIDLASLDLWLTADADGNLVPDYNRTELIWNI